nr:unnamed protein product [Digitaria exilis]
MAPQLDQFLLLAFIFVNFAGVAGVAGVDDEKPSRSLPPLLSALTPGLPLSAAPSPMESLLRAFRASVQYFLLVSSNDDTPHRRPCCKSSRPLFFSPPRGCGNSPPPMASLSSFITSRSVVVVVVVTILLLRERGDGASSASTRVVVVAAWCAAMAPPPLNPHTAGFALQGKNTMSPHALGVISSASASILIRCINCIGTLSFSSLGVVVHRWSSSWPRRAERSVEDRSLAKLVARPRKMSSNRLDVTRSNEEPLFVARHGCCGRPGGGLGLGGGGIFLCMSLPHALFLGTPGELSQEKGTCVRSGDDSRRHRGWRDDASTETHERRGVGSGESSSGAGGCPSALRSSLSVPARLVMMIWRSMENDATRRETGL